MVYKSYQHYNDLVAGRRVKRLLQAGIVSALLVLTGSIIYIQGNSPAALARHHRRAQQQGQRAELASYHKADHQKLLWRQSKDEDTGTDTAVPVAVVTDAPVDQPATAPAVTTTGLLNNPAPLAVLPDDTDHRQYMHGLDFVTVAGKQMVIFSSNGYTPVEPKDEWQDDIYYSYVDPANPDGSFSAKPLVSAAQAQEPASSAVSTNGKLLVTAEDAQFSQYLDQTYGLWDVKGSDLKPAVKYGAKLLPPQGGHSGHVAASGEKFLVSFSDGWIDGGGVNNMGTGDNVFGRIVNDDGTTGNLIKTSVGNNRDWWPIVAGSDSNWLQVWQRYGTAGSGGGTVLGAIIDHSGKIVKQLTIFRNNKYYYHDVQYIPALGLYLVTGSQNTKSNAGIAVLIDKAGNIVATKTGLPNTNRESQTIISDDGTTAVYPLPGVGLAVLNLTDNSIALQKTISLDWNWDYMGTDGIFTADKRVLFATGSQKGVRFIRADLQ